MLGSTLAIVPGHIHSLATVGDANASNVAGTVLLLVGTPITATLADRMFHRLR